MIAAFKQGYNFVAARPVLRALLRALVSLTLLALVVAVAQRTEALALLKAVHPGAIALAVGLYGAVCMVNSRRWQLLLRNAGIREPLGKLTALYLIGAFFSLFLPTSAGGDAVRIVEVARSSRRPTQAIVATLQERLLGLGSLLLVGLGALLYYLPSLPPELRIWIALAQVAALLGIALLLYPALIFAGARQGLLTCENRFPVLGRLTEHWLLGRVLGVLRPVAEAPPLKPPQLAAQLAMAGTASLMGIGMYYAVGQSLQIEANFLAYCLVVPLVWVARMLPVSMGGAGVGEGSLIFLFVVVLGVPEPKAAALAVVMLGLFSGLGMVGGLVLGYRVLRSTWSTSGSNWRRLEGEVTSPPVRGAAEERGDHAHLKL
jgi:uncharacterized membrane protein YbhN (UPF0104 family)